MVKDVQIYVAEQLAGQIADRQSTSILSKEQALASVKPKPILPTANQLTIYLRVEQNNLAGQPQDKVHVNDIGPGGLFSLPYLVGAHLQQRVGGNLQQPLPVDVHEIASDVKFQNIAFLGVVLTFLADMALHPLYTIVRTSALDATVGILNKCALKQLACIVVVQVMNNSVHKLGGKHFPLFRIINDEAFRWLGYIRSVEQGIAEFFQILAKVSLKVYDIGHISLVFPRIEESHIQVAQQILSCQCISHFR